MSVQDRCIDKGREGYFIVDCEAQKRPVEHFLLLLLLLLLLSSLGLADKRWTKERIFDEEKTSIFVINHACRILFGNECRR